MNHKSLILCALLLCLSAAAALAQVPGELLPSIAIRTDSERDSLIFRVRMDGELRFRIYFEDRLYADVPPFKEKYYAIQPQRDWSCVGTRRTEDSLDLIIFGDCEEAKKMTLKTLFEAGELPTEPFI